MCTHRKKSLPVIVILSMTLQGCMVTTPNSAICPGSVKTAVAPMSKTLPPQQPALTVPPVIHNSPTGSVTLSAVPNFLFNNITQLLLVCAVSGKCK